MRSSFKRCIGVIEAMTGRNDHNGSILYALERIISNRELEQRIKSINEKYEKEGHMKQEWIKERDEIREAMLAEAKKILTLEECELLQGAF